MKQKYVAFLRGINVGGHHKIPMADLHKELEKLKFKNVVTILNSGNIIFDANEEVLESLENRTSEHLESVFGFPVPTILRKVELISQLLEKNPFKNIAVTKETRFYVSFLRKDPDFNIHLPWMSEDQAYQIIEITDRMILSVLDVSISKTPKAMEALDRFFGKDITTRNWNTIKRIEKKLEVS